MNKKIYMTYYKHAPNFVLERWEHLSPDYKAELHKDDQCIDFLNNHFNHRIGDLFKSIPRGMYKADLWRLCKLYKEGGVYADVDLVPHLNINDLDKDVTFYSCLSKDNASIFQAFMVNFGGPKSPLILHFIISFIFNKAYEYNNGPTYDMYSCLKYNLNGNHISPEVKYDINEVKIRIFIGRSHEIVKKIDLVYFPNDVEYSINLHPNPHNYPDSFEFKIENNELIVTRLDVDYNYIGWCYEHSCDIILKCNERVMFFPEKMEGDMTSAHVTFNNNKILDSRDPYYFHHGGWN